jgi:hypothetical protein
VSSMAEVEHWMEVGARRVTHPNQTPNTAMWCTAVGLREMSFVVERETAQTDS